MKHLAESPPNRFHKGWIERFIIVVEIDPSAHSLYGRSPLSRVPHDNTTALGVILVDPHTHNVFSPGDFQPFVNFVLDRQTVGIPAESSGNVMPADMSMPGDDVLEVGLMNAQPLSAIMLCTHLDGACE